jgi:hypothetical protein
MSIWVKYSLAGRTLCKCNQPINLTNFAKFGGFSWVRFVIVIWWAKRAEKIVENELHVGPWWDLTKVGTMDPISENLKGGVQTPVTLPLKISGGWGSRPPVPPSESVHDCSNNNHLNVHRNHYCFPSFHSINFLMYVLSDWLIDWLIDWLFTVLRPAQEFFTLMETSPLPVKGYKL